LKPRTSAIQAASERQLRQAILAVCMVVPNPSLWHVHGMLEPGRYHGFVLARIASAARDANGTGVAAELDGRARAQGDLRPEGDEPEELE
jgi:hypothetical protein